MAHTKLFQGLEGFEDFQVELEVSTPHNHQGITSVVTRVTHPQLRSSATHRPLPSQHRHINSSTSTGTDLASFPTVRLVKHRLLQSNSSSHNRPIIENRSEWGTTSFLPLMQIWVAHITLIHHLSTLETRARPKIQITNLMLSTLSITTLMILALPYLECHTPSSSTPPTYSREIS